MIELLPHHVERLFALPVPSALHPPYPSQARFIRQAASCIARLIRTEIFRQRWDTPKYDWLQKSMNGY
jgi:hypothetical protein